MNKKKVIIYSIIVSILLIIIFLFSASNYYKSNGLSKGLIHGGITTYEIISGKKVDKELLIIKLNYPVRKIAHFTEYFILGILIYKLLFYIGKHKKLIYFNTIMLCILFASIDEFHQLFVGGRTSRIQDIIIDVSGSILAVLIIYIVDKIKNKNLEVK